MYECHGTSPRVSNALDGGNGKECHGGPLWHHLMDFISQLQPPAINPIFFFIIARYMLFMCYTSPSQATIR